MKFYQRIFKLKNMEVYFTGYLKDKTFDFASKTDEEIDEYYDKYAKYAEILIMDLRRPPVPGDNKDISWEDEYANFNYVKFVVLCNFDALSNQQFLSDIESFLDSIVGELSVRADIEFVHFDEFRHLEQPLEEEPDNYIRLKSYFEYYKKIGEHYGVQFEPGEFTEKKLTHLSQD